MNQLTTAKRKIMQFSLTPESQKILQSFSSKYGTSKSIVIDRALEMLAAHYHKKIVISFEIANDNEIDKFEKQQTTTSDDYVSDEEWNEIVKKIEKRHDTRMR